MKLDFNIEAAVPIFDAATPISPRGDERLSQPPSLFATASVAPTRHPAGRDG
jgi:hypothetical protein